MQRRRRYTNLKYSDTEWLYHRKLSLIKEEHFEKYQCLPKLWPDESLLSPLGNLSSFSDDFRYGSLCKPTWVKHIPMWMLWRLCEREIERWQPYLPESDYCLTTISRKASKAGFPSVFNGFSFFGKVFGACCFILLVATVQPKKILWDLWNFVRSVRFCQRSPLWRLSCFVRFRS